MSPQRCSPAALRKPSYERFCALAASFSPCPPKHPECTLMELVMARRSQLPPNQFQLMQLLLVGCPFLFVRSADRSIVAELTCVLARAGMELAVIDRVIDMRQETFHLMTRALVDGNVDGLIVAPQRGVIKASDR